MLCECYNGYPTNEKRENGHVIARQPIREQHQICHVMCGHVSPGPSDKGEKRANWVLMVKLARRVI